MNITGKLDLDANKVVLALIISAAIVSGCTEGGGSEDEGSQSVTVNEFSAFPNPTPADQNTQFRMTLVNDGDHDASSVYARLYNPPFGGSGDDKTFRNPNGNMDEEYRTLSFNTLNSEGDQTPAVPATSQKDFQSPDLESDRDVSYTFNSYIAFNYSTVGTADVQVLSQEEFRNQGSPQGSANLENSRAPVQMEVRTPTPIPIYDDASGNPEKDFCVIVRNQGSGTPFNPDAVPTGPTDGEFNLTEIEDKKNEVEVTVEDVGDVNFIADGTASSQTKTVEIFDSKGVGCFTMELTQDSLVQTTVPVRIDANYGYRKAERTSLRVEGRR
ncbi:hypothetical protein GLU64_00535 [Nanohaloarchaea archaeon]|nr:hypothetical protein [Candidatus Nanohaloarchaea archaeon]